MAIGTVTVTVRVSASTKAEWLALSASEGSSVGKMLQRSVEAYRAAHACTVRPQDGETVRPAVEASDPGALSGRASAVGSAKDAAVRAYLKKGGKK